VSKEKERKGRPRDANKDSKASMQNAVKNASIKVKPRSTKGRTDVAHTEKNGGNESQMSKKKNRRGGCEQRLRHKDGRVKSG